MNAVIYEQATGRIIAYIADAMQAGNVVRGSNGSYVIGARATGIGLMWTVDDVVRDESADVPVFTPANVSGLTEASTDRDIGIVDRADLIDRLDNLRDLARITYAQIETYIGANVTDLASAKTYLTRLTRETRDILRLVLYLFRKGV